MVEGRHAGLRSQCRKACRVEPVPATKKEASLFTDDQRRKYQKDLYKRRRKWAIDYLGGKCSSCNSTDNLTIDHKDPKKKDYNISPFLRSKNKSVLIEELNKCQCLCRKCHDKKTKKEGSQNCGSRNGAAKLESKIIVAIKNDPRSSRKIAKQYGVSHVAILNIKNEKSWKHIGGEPNIG